MSVLLIHLNPLIRTYQPGLVYITLMIVRKLDGTTGMVFISVTGDSLEPWRKTIDFINTCVKVPILSGSIYPTEEWIMKKQLPVGRDEEKTAAA